VQALESSQLVGETPTQAPPEQASIVQRLLSVHAPESVMAVDWEPVLLAVSASGSALEAVALSVVETTGLGRLPRQ
jgi:hypothetical protein